MTKHAFDPHDPKGKLQLISEEFVARPDHNEPPTSWRPGDSLLGDEAMKMSMEYYVWKVSRDAEQEREQHRIDLISYKELHRVRRWQRIKRGMATLALVVTGYGVAAPGGVIDRVASINTKTAEVATSVNVQQQYTPAKQRIVEAYSEIDAHGTDQLVKRAKDFRASHPDEFSSSSQIQKAHDRIGEVDTADELRASAEAFLTKYGVETVIISDSVSLDDTRDILHAITDVLGPLPTKFVLNQTVFNTLRIESSDDSNSDDGDRGGTMSSNGEMILYALPLSGQALQPVSAIFGQPMSYQHIVAHELIHAWQTKQGYDNSHYPSVDTSSLNTVVMDMSRHAIGKPEVPSDYSRNGGMEYGAEVLAGVLASDTSSLPSPVEWRKFNSRLTGAQLAQLAELDTSYPGIARLLIADRSVS